MRDEFKPQVAPDHYRKKAYLGTDRWVSYGNQVREVLGKTKGPILEIGVGNGIARDALRNLGAQVKTVDVDPLLKPDVVGSVTKLPFADNEFEMVLAAEVLEHLPYSEFKTALSEIRRVSGRFALLTLPHAGAVFLSICKIPLLPLCTVFFKIPFFWKTHIFNGEHYWELGKKNYSRKRIRRDIEKAGFIVVREVIDPQDPAHCFFLLEHHDV